MTPTECAEILAKHNAWRRGQGEASVANAPEHQRLIGKALDAAVRHLRDLEAEREQWQVDWYSAADQDMAKAALAGEAVAPGSDGECAVTMGVLALQARVRDAEALAIRHMKDAERYRTARHMSPLAWRDAMQLTLRTGKPYDQIIDELRPFIFPDAPTAAAESLPQSDGGAL